jgi:hypothetical protein
MCVHVQAINLAKGINVSLAWAYMSTCCADKTRPHGPYRTSRGTCGTLSPHREGMHV